MLQPEPMFLNFEKFLIQIEAFPEAPASLRGQLAFGVRQNFLKMVRHLPETGRIHEVIRIAGKSLSSTTVKGRWHVHGAAPTSARNLIPFAGARRLSRRVHG